MRSMSLLNHGTDDFADMGPSAPLLCHRKSLSDCLVQLRLRIKHVSYPYLQRTRKTIDSGICHRNAQALYPLFQV